MNTASPVSPGPASPIEVDARGLRCPLPVIRLAEAARDAPAGTRIVVLASDLAARYDIPAWCRMRDHDLLEITELGQVRETSAIDGQPAEREQPAYLRFVVLVRQVPHQPSKAGGTGSRSERSSRAR